MKKAKIEQNAGNKNGMLDKEEQMLVLKGNIAYRLKNLMTTNEEDENSVEDFANNAEKILQLIKKYKAHAVK